MVCGADPDIVCGNNGSAKLAILLFYNTELMVSTFLIMALGKHFTIISRVGINHLKGLLS